MGKRIQAKGQLDDILNKVVLIYVLAENGGVMLSDYYCLTETFDWLKQLKSDIHAKRGVDNVDP
jgi:hypothetical protein